MNDVYIAGGNYVGNATPTPPPTITFSDLKSVTVTYSVPAPGGLWGVEDNGTYTVSINGSQVEDINDVAALASSLGTFKADFATTFTVDKIDVDIDDGIYTPTNLTLREAVLLANKTTATDTINFASTIPVNSTITLTRGQMKITEALSITDTASLNLTVTAGNGDATANLNRFFDINVAAGSSSVAIANLHLMEAAPGTNGGAILNADESVTLTNMKFENNQAGGTGAGGAVYSSLSTVFNIGNSTFTNNFANSTNGGGALYFDGVATVTITNSTFENNQTPGHGGAIRGDSTFNLDVSGSTFKNNQANGTGSGGGAIAAYLIGNMSVTVNTSLFEGNSARGFGGAIYVDSLDSSTATFNTSTLSVTDSTFKLNTANSGGSTTSYSGGAISIDSSNAVSLTIDGSVFLNNTVSTTGHGGAVHAGVKAVAMITDSSFKDNAAKTFGGALYFSSSATTTIEGTLLANNTVDGSSAAGGAIFISGGSLAFHHGAIVNNAAKTTNSSFGSGGGIYSSTASVEIWNSTLSGNQTYSDDTSNLHGGGAIEMGGTSGGALTILNSTLSNNSANFTVPAAKARGGAIFNNRTTPVMTFESTIIAGNNNANGFPDIYQDNAGTITSNKSIIGVADGLSFSGVGNQSGTLNSPFNPGMFALDTVTYSMPVHPLWYVGPAKDAGSNILGFTNDVRGSDREVPDGSPDVGSFEGFADVAPFVSSVKGIVNVTSIMRLALRDHRDLRCLQRHRFDDGRFQRSAAPVAGWRKHCTADAGQQGAERQCSRRDLLLYAAGSKGGRRVGSDGQWQVPHYCQPRRGERSRYDSEGSAGTNARHLHEQDRGRLRCGQQRIRQRRL